MCKVFTFLSYSTLISVLFTSYLIILILFRIVCLYVCMYICMYVCVYVCTYVYVCMYMYICTYVFALCVRIYVCKYICMYSVYVCVNVCEYLYVCMSVTRDNHTPGGIPTPTPSKRAAVERRIRPRGDWDRSHCQYTIEIPDTA